MNIEASEPPRRGADKSVEPFSSAWWRNRSAEELRAIMNRGLGVGAAFEGATAEAERRALERYNSSEQAEKRRIAHNTEFRRIILEALLLACLLILLSEMLRR
jgi:hypothetical protein